MSNIAGAKPEFNHEYIEWLATMANLPVDDRLLTRMKDHYETVALRMRTDFSGSRFWKRLKRELKEYNSQYYVSRGGHNLLMYQTLQGDRAPQAGFASGLREKSWGSFYL